MTKDYSVTIKIKNNRLLEKMRAAGFESALGLSRASGVSGSGIGQYLNMKRAPVLRDGGFSQSVIKLSEFLRCLPEDLFPKAHLEAPLKKNTAEFTADATDIFQISASLSAMALPTDEKLMITESKKALDELLNTLPPRERGVIEQRFGLVDGQERTLGDVAGEPSCEMARQIELKALRRLRAAVGRDRKLSSVLWLGITRFRTSGTPSGYERN